MSQPVQSQPGYVVSQYPTSGALQVAVGSYLNRGYKQVSNLGSSIALERSPAFHALLAFLLLFLFGVGALVYVLVYVVQRQANTRRVELLLRPDGQVEALGYTLHDLERDTLVVARRWRLFWTVVLWLTAAFFVLVVATMLVEPLKPGDSQGTVYGAAVMSACIAAAAFAGGWYLWRRAGRMGQELSARYAR